MQDLDSKDRQIIQSIFNRAECKYNEEVQMNPHTSFNLLKLLSAYNDVLPQYGLSSITQNKIYNHLVSVSKIYNPASQQQWSRALSKSSSRNSSQFKHKFSQIRRTNTPVSQFLNESMDNSKISLNSKSRSRITNKSIDKKHLMAYRNNNKDQIKQYDQSEQIFKKDLSRFNTTHNLTLSRDRMKTMMSFPTCNTQDSVEIYEDDNQEDEKQREKVMQTRAQMFYKINVYSKVFLIIKASIMVKEELKAHELKMLARIQKMRVKSHFKQFKNILECVCIKQQKYAVAYMFHDSKLKKKTLKCLKAIKQLSTKSNHRLNHQLIKNNLALSFILEMMCLSLDEESREKLNYFWKQKRYKQVKTLINVFSKNSVVQPETLLKIQDLYDTNIKQKVFSAFKQHFNARKGTQNSLMHLQKQQVLQKLHQNLRSNKQFQQKQNLCVEKIRSKVSSNCLYFWKRYMLVNKKKQIITNHIKTIYSHQLKRFIIDLLHNQLNITKQAQLIRQQNNQRVLQQYQKDQLYKYFYALKKNYLLSKKNQLQNQKADIFMKKRLVSLSFQGLLKNILICRQQKCLMRLLQQNKKNQLCNIFKRWKRQTSMRLIMKVAKRVQLRNIFWNICESVLEQKLYKRNSSYSDNFYKNMIWNRLVSQININKLDRQNRIQKIRQSINEHNKIGFFNQLDNYYKQSKQYKNRSIQITNKLKIVEMNINKQIQKRSINQFIEVATKLKCSRQSTTQLINYRKRQVFNSLRQQLNHSNTNKKNKQLTSKLFFNIHLIKLKKYVIHNKQSRVKFQSIQIFQSQKSNKQIVETFRIFKRFQQIIQLIQNKSNYQNQLRLLSLVFRAFKTNCLIEKGIQQIANRNIKRINKGMKNRVFKQCRCIINKQIQIKHSNQQLIQMLKYNQYKQLFRKYKKISIIREIVELDNNKLDLCYKSLFFSRLKRVQELRPISIQYLTRRIWLDRFLKNVNKELIKRKMDQMAIVHYMQTILAKSVKALKQPRDNQVLQ